MVDCVESQGQKAYFDFIDEHGQSMPFPSCHEHHIVPRFLFGKTLKPEADCPSNICYLTPSQHLTAHWKLLGCFEPGHLDWASAAFALFAIAIHPQVRYLVNEEEYRDICQLMGKATSIRPVSKESRIKRSESSKGHKKSETTKQRMSESKTGCRNPNYGKPAHNRGKPQSQTAKEKQSKSMTGRKPSNAGKRTYNNGIEQRSYFPEEVPAGWRLGEIPGSRKAKAKSS